MGRDHELVVKISNWDLEFSGNRHPGDGDLLKTRFSPNRISGVGSRRSAGRRWAAAAMAELRNRRLPGYEYGGELGLEDLQPKAPLQPSKWRRAVENTLWLGAAAFVVYYGDGRVHFFSVLSSDPRILRRPFYLGLVCMGINTLIFLYLAVWLRHVIRTDVNWEIVAPGAIPTATILGVSAFLMFVFALWPVWGFLTLPLLVTLFMSFVIISPFLPPYTKNTSEREGYSEDNLYKNHD